MGLREPDPPKTELDYLRSISEDTYRMARNTGILATLVVVMFLLTLLSTCDAMLT